MDNIKQKIVDAVKYAQEQLGFKLVDGSWGNSQNKCACPMGCVLLQNNKSFTEDDGDASTQDAADILGVSRNWVACFISGFDHEDDISLDTPMGRDAFKLGLELHNELLPSKAESDLP